MVITDFTECSKFQTTEDVECCTHGLLLERMKWISNWGCQMLCPWSIVRIASL